VRGEDGDFHQIIKLRDVGLWQELAFFNNLSRLLGSFRAPTKEILSEYRAVQK
jgi:hypothetical protein